MTTKNYQLIAIDMDGTLLNSNQQITEPVKEAILKAKQAGIKIVLATGRAINGMDYYLQELDLYHPNEYAITSNGSLLIELLSNQAVIRYGITKAQFLNIHEAATKHQVGYVIETDHAYYTTHTVLPRQVGYLSYINNLPLVIVDAEDIPENVHFLKAMVTDSRAKMAGIIDQMAPDLHPSLELLMSAGTILEVLNPQATKAQALEALIETLGIAAEEVLAIGDNQNDLDMLQFAGTGVAMGNAIEEVKATADYVTKSNNQDGVAHAINHLIFNE